VYVLSVLGNEAKHITMKNATSANEVAAAVPAPANYTYTTLSVSGVDVSFVECDGPAVIIPDGETQTLCF